MEPYESRSNDYAYALFAGKPSCEADVLTQLAEIQKNAAAYAQTDGKCPEDEYFYAEQNARVLRTASAIFAR